MEIKKGTAVSPGVAIGEAFLLEREGTRIPRRFVMPEEVDHEVTRFDKALAHARRDIEKVAEELAERLHADYDVGDIFRMHLKILADPKLRDRITRLIRHRNFTPEYAVSHVMRQYARPFEHTTDSYMAQRAADFADMEHRLLNTLLGEKTEDLAHLSEPVIVVANNLTPSQTVSLNREKILAFVTDAGGRTSHSAILARALEIPAVVGLGELSAQVSGGDTLVVDGTHGLVIVSPDEDTMRRYEERGREMHQFEARLNEEFRDLPAVTLDGREINLMGNIEFPSEVAVALRHGARGIGLYRTEFLVHQSDAPPDENVHFEAYMEAVRQLGERPLVIRLFDLGADKFPTGPPERNPFLGLRSTRLLLQNQDILRSQLRAVLRVSAFGTVRFMFPLISSLSELRRAKLVVKEVMADLDREGVSYDRDVAVGMMIEVPSAAVMADQLAKEVDFFSLGTNDLIQYTLAVDRDNASVAHLFSPADPAVLRLMRNTIRAARDAGIHMAICGEMAGDVLYTIPLIGLGLRDMSVSPKVIPEIKKVIRSITFEGAQKVAEEVCSLDTAEEAVRLLEQRAREILPEAF